MTREELEGREKPPWYTSHPHPPDPVHEQDDDEHLLLRMAKTGGQKKYGARIAVRPDQPALTQIREHGRVTMFHKDRVRRMIDVLGAMRFLDLSPESMRGRRSPPRPSWATAARTCRPS